MAKRYRDTDCWKKPFIKMLPAAYKLFWFYILDDCDHAGIWQVDMDVARLRVGEEINTRDAINLFGERIEVFDNGNKWYMPDFIEFQYGKLDESNRVHKSVLQIHEKHEIGKFAKGHRSIINDAIILHDKDKDKDKDKDRQEISKLVFVDDQWLEVLKMNNQGKDIPKAWNDCYLYWTQSNSPPSTAREWRQRLASWLTNVKHEKSKPNAYQKGKFVA